MDRGGTRGVSAHGCCHFGQTRSGVASGPLDAKSMAGAPCPGGVGLDRAGEHTAVGLKWVQYQRAGGALIAQPYGLVQLI